MNAPFDWSHYLDLALELASCRSDDALVEARQRCAVSRAYYSVFIRARNHLQRKDGIRVPSRNTHEFVVNQYRAGASQQRQEIADYLNELRKYRTLADYEDHAPNLGKFVELVLGMAKETANLISGRP